MQQLREWVRDDPNIRTEALPLFQRAIAADPDRWTAIHAAHGIATVAGPEAAGFAWRSLLARADADTVAATACALTDRAFVPDLLGVLNHRTERTIRQAILRSFGRMRDPRTLQAILWSLEAPDLRPHAIEALADFGDPSTITHLHLLLNDTTDAWPEDNHGPMLRVCDLAKAAIEQLSRERGSGRRPDAASEFL